MPYPYSMPLRGKRIFVVEDCYLVAQELSEALDREGADIVGPVASLDAAWRSARNDRHLDAAILDVKLGGEMVWPVADILFSNHVRIVFATGYPRHLIRQRYASFDVVEKPAPAGLVVRLLSSAKNVMAR